MNPLRWRYSRTLATVLTLLPALLAADKARADLQITEILAVANVLYPDDDGAPSDWIEITNNGAAAESLAGHYLTNNATDLTRWAFPAETIPAGGSIVVYASGKDRAVVGAPLHTSFTLDRGGDYVGLIAPDGMTPVTEIAPAYPPQYDGVSFGFGAGGLINRETTIAMNSQVRYEVPLDASLGSTWHSPAFDDSGWAEVTQPAGFESGTTGGLYAVIETDIENLLPDMKGVNASGYFRFPFNFSTIDRQASGLQLSAWSDDGFVAYLNGVEVARLNAPTPLTFNSGATGTLGDSNVIAGPQVYDLSAFAGSLVDGQNVLAVQAMNTSANSSDFVIGVEMLTDVQDTSAGSQNGFFELPTPGTPNGLVLNAPPAGVDFSRDSEMFTSDFSLALSCATPGAIIRYTTDLTVPSNELGAESPLYAGPISIDSSTQVRARAFLPGALPGEVNAETFLKMDASVAAFSSDLPMIVVSTLGGGAPPESGATTRKQAWMFFFDRDPVTGRTRLTDVPQIGTRAGVRKRGSSSSGWPKYALSVETWNDGDDEDRNIEPLDFDREADWILSARYQFDRALMRNPFIYEMSRQVGRYAVRTRFVEMYNDVDGGTVDDNDYFGVYSLMEKIESDPNRVDVARIQPWENADPEITGGYIFKKDRADPGEPGFSVSGMGGLVHVDPDGLQISADQKSYLVDNMNELNAALTNPPSGINTATGLHYSDYLDVESFIDHHWLNTLAMNVDWGRLSAYFHKDRQDVLNAGPIWDFDRNMGSEDGRDSSPLRWDGTGDSSMTWFDGRYPWFGNLVGPTADPAAANYPDVRQQHTDRWFELREGPFSEANIHAVIDGMAAEIAEAAPRNFARWTSVPPNGGTFAAAGLTGWEAEVSHMKGWLSARVNWIDDQYFELPSFNQNGGLVAPGFQLILTSPDAGVYYTLDGSDPRAPGGVPSPGAIQFAGGPIDEVLVAADAAGRYFIPVDNSLGLTWTQDPSQFDDSSWTAGASGYGFESAGGTLEPLVVTDTESVMKGINATGYFRTEFSFSNTANINSLELRVRADDGYIAYLNGVQIASEFAPPGATWNSSATGSRGDGAIFAAPSVVDVSAFKSAVIDGVNVLAVHGMNSSAGSSDFLIEAELEANHTVAAGVATLNNSALVTARAYDGSQWSAPSQAGFIIASDPAAFPNLVVSEIMYRPAPPTAAEMAAGFADRDDFEWIELLNIGSTAVALLGCEFDAGVTFAFDNGSVIELMPGERVLVVKSRAAFEERYGTANSSRIAGEFANGTGLSNGGEQISLFNTLTSGIIKDFEYNDRAPWPEAPDGDGYSLVLVAPESNPDHSLPGSWQSSAVIGGTPGTGGGQSYTAWAAANGVTNPSDDSDADGLESLLEYALGSDPSVANGNGPYLAASTSSFTVGGVTGEHLVLTVRKNLAAADATLTPEISSDAQNWAAAGMQVEFVEELHQGDGTAQMVFRTTLPISMIPEPAKFLRMRASL